MKGGSGGAGRKYPPHQINYSREPVPRAGEDDVMEGGEGRVQEKQGQAGLPPGSGPRAPQGLPQWEGRLPDPPGRPAVRLKGQYRRPLAQWRLTGPRLPVPHLPQVAPDQQTEQAERRPAAWHRRVRRGRRPVGAPRRPSHAAAHACGGTRQSEGPGAGRVRCFSSIRTAHLGLRWESWTKTPTAVP